ncbi:hypothetical protein [Polyangium aurulentum]|uniref:hypothetical protein n=1 Tax=Polyangium aurulentum TaxID=2567896 RepID=UPI0010AE6B6C|nr:hypothetical protein [Polyangium aurulentum]UQA60362.1 hypothetical protein E8A73_007780 [Polyangium aurulentum]
MSRTFHAAILAASALAAGCDPTISALTLPPPTAVAELDATAETVRLSQGIALAVECKYRGSPCESAEASSDDEAIVKVLPAYVDLLAPGDGTGYTQRAASDPRAVFVIVGNGQGAANVTITSEDASDAILSVTVLPPP